MANVQFPYGRKDGLIIEALEANDTDLTECHAVPMYFDREDTPHVMGWSWGDAYLIPWADYVRMATMERPNECARKLMDRYDAEYYSHKGYIARKGEEVESASEPKEEHKYSTWKK